MEEVPCKIPCSERKCAQNCYHAFSEYEGYVCMISKGDPPRRFEVKYGQDCQHTDQSYEEGFRLVVENPQTDCPTLSEEDCIRKEYGIPDDVPLDSIDYQNHTADCMARAHAVFNMRPPAVLM